MLQPTASWYGAVSAVGLCDWLYGIVKAMAMLASADLTGQPFIQATLALIEYQPRWKNSIVIANPIATIPARSAGAGMRRAMRAPK